MATSLTRPASPRATAGSKCTGADRGVAGQRLEHLERHLSLAGAPMSGAENQPGVRVSGDGLEDLIRLFYRECGILLQRSSAMRLEPHRLSMFQRVLSAHSN